MLAEVKARLEAQVPELAGRVGLALDFQRLLSSGAMPTGGVNAWVLPRGTRGLEPSVAVGDFTQPVWRQVSVVTMLQAVDATGTRALERVDTLLEDIQFALMGWSWGDTPGVFELEQERSLQAPKGLMGWMTDFRILDRKRIST